MQNHRMAAIRHEACERMPRESSPFPGGMQSVTSELIPEIRHSPRQAVGLFYEDLVGQGYTKTMSTPQPYNKASAGLRETMLSFRNSHSSVES